MVSVESEVLGEETGVDLSWLGFVLPMLALIAVNLLVIIGNVMVIAAVFTHSKLRSTTTNKFVVSLALADLMVGVIVLPFSSVNQVCMHRRTGQFCLGGASFPEKNSTAPEKNGYATCKKLLCLTHSTHIGKNPGFRAFHIAGRNEFRFFSV